MRASSFLWRSFPQSRSPQQSRITNFWPSAPVNIDGAYENQHADRVYIFKGTFDYFYETCFKSQPCANIQIQLLLSFPPVDQQVWAFAGYNLVRGYPQRLTTFGLPRSVRKIDAAFYDVESRKTLFFVGSYYYR